MEALISSILGNPVVVTFLATQIANEVIRLLPGVESNTVGELILSLFQDVLSALKTPPTPPPAA